MVVKIVKIRFSLEDIFKYFRTMIESYFKVIIRNISSDISITSDEVDKTLKTYHKPPFLFVIIGTFAFERKVWLLVRFRSES